MMIFAIKKAHIKGEKKAGLRAKKLPSAFKKNVLVFHICTVELLNSANSHVSELRQRPPRFFGKR